MVRGDVGFGQRAKLALMAWSFLAGLVLVRATLLGALMVAIPAGLLLVPKAAAGLAQLPSSQRFAVVSVWCMLFSSLVWRGRDAEQLAANPLDSAGVIRVLFIAVGGVIAVVSLLGTRHMRTVPTPKSARLYLGYVATIPLGVLMASQPQIVIFRFANIVCFVAAWYACHRAFRGEYAIPFRHLQFFLWLLVFTVVLGLVVNRSAVLLPTFGGVFNWRLIGYIPSQSSNELGAIGVLFTAIGLASPRERWPALVAGSSLVLLAQYRTGYIAVAVVVVSALLLRRKVAFRSALVAGIAACWLLWSNGFLAELWSRGESSVVLGTLNSRTIWWSAALESWHRSPLVGAGLSSATRFDALAVLGRTMTSTIHSTWIEALAGTGLIGAGLLLASLVGALWRAFETRGNDPVRKSAERLLVLAGITVLSLTGTTLELPTFLLLAFLFCQTPRDLPAYSQQSHEKRVKSLIS